jgi:hypothetical protein
VLSGLEMEAGVMGEDVGTGKGGAQEAKQDGLEVTVVGFVRAWAESERPVEAGLATLRL